MIESHFFQLGTTIRPLGSIGFCFFWVRLCEIRCLVGRVLEISHPLATPLVLPGPSHSQPPSSLIHIHTAHWRRRDQASRLPHLQHVVPSRSSQGAGPLHLIRTRVPRRASTHIGTATPKPDPSQATIPHAVPRLVKQTRAPSDSHGQWP
jgi:hypothetical protein